MLAICRLNTRVLAVIQTPPFRERGPQREELLLPAGYRKGNGGWSRDADILGIKGKPESSGRNCKLGNSPVFSYLSQSKDRGNGSDPKDGKGGIIWEIDSV